MLNKRSVVERQAFAKALEDRTPKSEVMRNLGIGGSTYYLWKSQLAENGDLWLNGIPTTRAIRACGMTVKSTHEMIVELSLLHPTLGPKKLTLIHERDGNIKHISPSTIHNILSEHGLGSRRLRSVELHKRYLAGNKLTDEQLRLVKSIDPLVGCDVPKGKSVGEVLCQDVLRFHHSSPFGNAPLSIVVDTHSGIAFACFPESAHFNLTTDCARMAIDELRVHGCVIKEMHVDSGWEFGRGKSKSPYDLLLKTNGIRRRSLNSRPNHRSPYVLDVWNDIHRFLCEGGVPEPEKYRKSLSLLNPLIKEYLNKNYNT